MKHFIFPWPYPLVTASALWCCWLGYGKGIIS